jgi:hypothetical protein
MRFSWIACLWLLASCSTALTRADGAYERGDYIAAAEQYDLLAQQSPADADLRARRDDARRRAAAVYVARVDQARRDGNVPRATEQLVLLLEARDRWELGSDPTVAAAASGHVAWATDRVRTEVGALLQARRPLGAEQALAHEHEVLAHVEFAALWPSLAAQVRAAGGDECARITPPDPAAAPYLTGLASAYCRHFGVAVAAPPRPEAIAGVAVAVDVDGGRAPDVVRLQSEVARWFADSPWYSGDGSAPVAATLRGHVQVELTAQNVTMDAPWVEQVPYSVSRTRQVPYQEAYQDQETYTVQVPHTTHRHETYSCGSGTQYRTCSRSVPHTEYRSETRHRSVTRYRTKHRTEHYTETHYRSEPRVYHYPAVRREGVYAGALILTVPLGAGEGPMVVRIARTDSRAGFDHGAEFAAADVHPSRADVTGEDDWFSFLVAQLESQVRPALAARWAESFCRVEAFTPESAARCAYGAPMPDAARAALASVLGDDVDLAAGFAARH